MPDEPPSESPPPENSKPSRRRAGTPQKRLTEEQKQGLREILLRPDIRRPDSTIDIPTVQKLTGHSYNTIVGFIGNDRYLHAQVPNADLERIEPKDSEQIDPPANQLPMPPNSVVMNRDQFEEYQKLLRQNKRMLAKDWQSFGLTEEQGARFEHYCRLGKAPIGGVLSLVGGQLITNISILERLTALDAERIFTDSLPPENDKTGAPREEGDVQRDWRHTLLAEMDLQVKIFDRIHKVQALAARTMRELQQINKGRSPDEKADFDSRT